MSESGEPKEIRGFIEGMIVHYVLPDGIRKGEHRPAIIVKIWNRDQGTSNLQVFMDGNNDGAQYATGLLWATSIYYSGDKLPGTWHPIEWL